MHVEMEWEPHWPYLCLVTGVFAPYGTRRLMKQTAIESFIEGSILMLFLKNNEND